jgi:hypothetical protein
MVAGIERLHPRVHAVDGREASGHRKVPRPHLSVRGFLTTPLIYSLGLPLVMLDIWVSVYQWVCFPIYGIDRVRRDSYFALDRHRLAYLNAVEKANCLYCGYATGLLAYVREVTARTEQYWCPIKHARRVVVPHRRYANFVEYGDAAGYRRRLAQMRRTLQPARVASARERSWRSRR